MKFFVRISAVVAIPVLLSAALVQARVDAIYIVPTVDSDLVLAAQFPARSDQNFYGSPEAMGLLRFALPEELTGVDTEFEIHRKADGTWTGVGTDGSVARGTCGPENKKWFACHLKFESLVFDLSKRENILVQRFGRGFEFDQRTLVARHFEGQPIGIIKIRTGRD